MSIIVSKRQDVEAPNTVIIEIRGGVVVEVYSDVPNVRVNLVDWDEIKDSSGPYASLSDYAACALSEMPRETRDQLSIEIDDGV